MLNYKEEKGELQMLTHMDTVAVVGNGIIGHGVTELFARAGYTVVLIGRRDVSLNSALEKIKISLKEFTEESLLAEADISMILKRITISTNLEAAQNATVVIEALPEDMQLKIKTFGQLEKICRENAILATASGHCVSEVIGEVKKRDRVIATHFWFPPQLLPLVEVCGAPETSKETIELTCRLLTGIGKKPVVIDKEIDGFIGNRIQFAALREAWSLYASGVASAEAIDSIVRYSIGRRYAVTGPIESADIAGLPVMVNFAAYLQPSLSVDKVPPKQLFELAKRAEGTVYKRSKEETERLLAARKKELFRWLAKDREDATL